LFVFSNLLLLLTGCSNNRLPRPDDLPAIYPCKITATFGGVPVKDVQVVLIAKSGNEKWKPSGLTNAEGHAELASSYGFKGVPTGVYTVTFSLIQEPDEEETRRGVPKMSLIPLKYSQGKSTETVEIKAKRNEFSFNLDAGSEPLPKR
jgi:5-hydroxyisourate hydrolase-like protein (transthyretin family)